MIASLLTATAGWGWRGHCWGKAFKGLLQQPRPVNASADATPGSENPVHVYRCHSRAQDMKMWGHQYIHGCWNFKTGVPQLMVSVFNQKSQGPRKQQHFKWAQETKNLQRRLTKMARDARRKKARDRTLEVTGGKWVSRIRGCPRSHHVGKRPSKAIWFC